MRLRIFIPIAVLLATAAAAAADEPQGRRWALLIGVNDYANLEDLRYCAADMRDLKQHLVDVGFEREQVFLIHSEAGEIKYQPFRANIEKQLDLVLGFVEPDDLMLVAFSGHGVFVDGQTFLCPAEADVDRTETLLPVQAVYKKLHACRASLKLMIVDACRNDPRPAGRRSATPQQDLSRLGQAFQKPPEGIVLLASCAPGEISMESEEFGRGVFMNYLLDAFTGAADKDGDGRISLAEAAEYAGLKTKLYVARTYNDSQRPYLTGDTTIEALAYSIGIRLPPLPVPLPKPPVIRVDPELDMKITQLSEKIRINPRDSMAYNDRGLEWWRKGDHDKAIADFTEALRIVPNESAVYGNLALAWDSKGEYDKALANFNEAIRLNPKDAIAYANRGSTWLNKKDYQQALSNLNYAIRLDPRNAITYKVRGDVWKEQNEYDKAIADYTEAIRLDPTFAYSHRHRGEALAKLGKYPEALAEYNAAIRLDPKYAYAYAYLAMLRATCPDQQYRDGKQALELATKAHDLDGGESAVPLAALAAAHAELGDFDEALRWQTKAIELCTNDNDRAEARDRLQIYRSGRPYREPAAGSSPAVDEVAQTSEAA